MMTLSFASLRNLGASLASRPQAPGDSLIVFPYQAAADLLLRLPCRAENGYSDATVIVDSEDNLKAVMSQIQDMDLRTRSLLDFVEMIQSQVATVTWVLSALAVVALFVSALGITNTMVMSVVERTHEIGVMKAVGARDGHILLLFLFESALIGLLGAAVAVLIGWLASFPLDAYARSILDRRLSPAFAGERVIFFPYWLAFVVPAFSALVTTLAGVLPARRAARISPIVALRHE
ncbi:MAG: FtsX-like permease family protein [Planctomycetaceae bacterium]